MQRGSQWGGRKAAQRSQQETRPLRPSQWERRTGQHLLRRAAMLRRHHMKLRRSSEGTLCFFARFLAIFILLSSLCFLPFLSCCYHNNNKNSSWTVEIVLCRSTGLFGHLQLQLSSWYENESAKQTRGIQQTVEAQNKLQKHSMHTFHG